MTDVPSIKWPEITPEGRKILEAKAAREFNEIARQYGATPIPVPTTVLDPKPRPETRYRVRSASEVMLSEPIQWRVKSVIPERGIAAIYGPSGSGKSFLVMDMAISIAKGSEWFGYRVKSCPVVYVCLEGEAGLSVRLRAAQCKGGIPRKIEFIAQPVNLLDTKDLRDLVTAIKANQLEQGVVIIDTLNRAVPGMDENSSVDMGQAINACKLIQQGLGGLVLLVHHSGKDATKGMRGHSSLHAALDASIEVKRSGDEREWSVAKAKDGADGKGHQFILEVVEMGEDDDGDPITSCVIRVSHVSSVKDKPLTKVQQQGMDAFMEASASNIGGSDSRVHARIDQWRKAFYRNRGSDADEANRKAFSRVRDELIKFGLLSVEGEIYRLSGSFPDLSKAPNGAGQAGHVRDNGQISL